MHALLLLLLQVFVVVRLRLLLLLLLLLQMMIVMLLLLLILLLVILERFELLGGGGRSLLLGTSAKVSSRPYLLMKLLLRLIGAACAWYPLVVGSCRSRTCRYSCPRLLLLGHRGVS